MVGVKPWLRIGTCNADWYLDLSIFNQPLEKHLSSVICPMLQMCDIS